MSDSENRRDFLAKGTLAAASLWAASSAAEAQENPPPKKAANEIEAGGYKLEENFQEYSRYKPTYGGPPGSDQYMGKLIPGRTAAGQPPVPVTCPDIATLPYKIKNGVKEFHLHLQPVEQEFLPGYSMNVYGFNGSMPGPTIEAYQGDRIRIVVHNELPEESSVHWHGLELPVRYDGVQHITQDPIKPGKSFAYEFDLHQTGSFFYHTHYPMQEAFGTVGFLIIHPQIAFDPVVDRDFGLIFQNFFIPPNQTIADSMKMDWNWHTINGRSGPYTTPLVVRHGERVRVRLLNFSPMQHHPIHLHGHTFWLTGSEGGRIPSSAWIPRNNVVTGVAMVQEFEFIAFNPGDWMFHCHMVHHMMNHMVRQVGPRIREGISVDSYQQNLDHRPPVKYPHTQPGYEVPGFPQNMMGMEMSPEFMKKIMNRREVQGLRNGWPMALHGLMTLLRVLPDDLYHKVMHTNEKIPAGASVPGAGPGMKMDHMQKNTDKSMNHQHEPELPAPTGGN